jgi:hypothetical protein
MRARPSRQGRSRSKASCFSPVFRLSVSLVWDPLPTFVFRLLFSGLWTPGELDDPGSGCPYVLQLLPTRVGGAAGRHPRGMPGGRGRRGAGRELDGEPPPRPWWARHPAHCNTPPTKAALPSPSVGGSTRTHSTLLTLSSSLRVKGLTRRWYGWWTKAYKLAPPLLN